MVVLVATRNKDMDPVFRDFSVFFDIFIYHDDTEAHHEHHGVGKEVLDLESFAGLISDRTQ